MSSLVVYETKDKIIGYRPLPVSFEGYWKVGDAIKSTDDEDCIIIDIISNTLVNRERINQEKTRQEKINRSVSRHKKLQVTKPNIELIIKTLIKALSKENHSAYLKFEGLKIDDFIYSNIIGCFTNLIINGQKINCKIIKINESNVMTYEFISDYLECDIETIDLELSIIDEGYTFEFLYEKIFLYKGNEIFTLKILHVDHNDIISRLPKYMKEIRKRTT
jgi:hypothetical protein